MLGLEIRISELILSDKVKTWPPNIELCVVLTDYLTKMSGKLRKIHWNPSERSLISELLLSDFLIIADS